MSKKQVKKSLWRGAVAGLIGGLIGAYVKSLVEPPLQKVGENLFPSSPKDLAKRGADITGHPLNMPPAVLFREVSNETTGETPSAARTEQGMTAIHYVFGAALGAAYGIVAETVPFAGNGFGAPAGALMWSITHGTTVPALGLQAPTRSMPAAWYVWELGSHVVYGTTCEIVRRIVREKV